MHLLICSLLVVIVLCVTAVSSASESEENHLSAATCSSRYSDPAALIIQALHKSIVDDDCELASPTSFPAPYKPKNGEEFDFIIVGSGSAGNVVANRLTEVSGWSVLLIEAGGNPSKTTEVPALTATLQKTEVDWQYKTEPSDSYCLGMEGNRCNWPRGKLLGGSSSINYNLYIRGNAKDYNGWLAEGNVGWGYEDVLPYFKKSEDMKAEEVINTHEFSRYHSTGGYLKVEQFQNSEVKSLADVFTEGMEELGYNANHDCNGKTQTGFARVQGTLKDGRRCSTAKAFLTPIISRKNLKVSKNSFASRILVDKKKKTAYGVEFIDKDGNTISVRAKKEVILSAGAINSPQLLMLSGIGPKEHLQNLNIDVIKDLPVGRNLQDHMLMIGFYMSLNYSKSTELPDESMFKFLMKRNSMFSSIGASTYVGFINTVKGVDYPDIQFLLLEFPKNDTVGLPGFLSNCGIRDEIKKKYLEINQNSFVIVLMASLLRPYSRGNIQLSSKDPKVKPKITAGYLSDKRDIETYLRTYDFISQLVETKALKKLDSKFHELKIPGCNKLLLGSREYRECTLRHLTTTFYHPSCTCRMGPPSCPDSVVDPSLNVKGINNLRVIDASAMRSLTSGNINAVVIMMGEKGSDLIKRKWLEEPQ